MSDKQCGDVIDSSQRTLALAIKLVDATIEDLPTLVEKTLQSPEVRKAIHSALEREAKRLVDESALIGSPVGMNGAVQLNLEQSKELASRLGRSFADASLMRMRKEIESSPAAKRLKDSAKQVLDDFKCSPTGVWVNDNKTMLIIVGTVLGLAGVAGPYFAKWGDPIGSLVEKRMLKFDVGQVKFGGQITKFEPSSQTIGIEFKMGTEWQAVKGKKTPNRDGVAELTFKGTAKGATAETSLDGRLVFPLAPRISLLGQGHLGISQIQFGPGPAGSPVPPLFDYSAGLGLRVADDGISLDVLTRIRNGAPSLGAGFGYDRKIGPARLRIDLGLDYRPWAATGTSEASRFRMPSVMPAGTGGLFQKNSDAVFELGGTVKVLF